MDAIHSWRGIKEGEFLSSEEYTIIQRKWRDEKHSLNASLMIFTTSSESAFGMRDITWFPSFSFRRVARALMECLRQRSWILRENKWKKSRLRPAGAKARRSSSKYKQTTEDLVWDQGKDCALQCAFTAGYTQRCGRTRNGLEYPPRSWQ
jgi:hypothetical protein